jgi:hypothetical protein
MAGSFRRKTQVFQQIAAEGRALPPFAKVSQRALRPKVFGYLALRVAHLVSEAALTRGARQAFFDRADPRVGADIEASGGAADFLAADLSALAEVRGLADAAQAMADRLDILIYKTQVPGLRARRFVLLRVSRATVDQPRPTRGNVGGGR